MSSVWTVKEKSQGELEVTISGDNWKKAQKKAFDKIAKNFKMDGFRQGQVPLALVKKHVSNQQVLLEAVEMSAQKALEEGFEEHKLEPIVRPTLDVKSLTEEEAVVVFQITVRPEVKLGEYKGLSMDVEDVLVSTEEVNKEVDRIRENYAELVLKEGEDDVVEMGDIAVINFKGFVDGVAFEGGEGENYPLEIGSGSFIPGFEEQLVGVKSNASKDVVVMFPENYGAEHLAGKEATFACTVNEIKKKVLPELTEEIIAELHMEGVKTEEELRERLTNQMLEAREKQAEAKAFETLLDGIVSSSEVEIPDVMIQEESDNLMIEFSQRLQSAGYSIEAFKEASNQTDEDLNEQMWNDAVVRVKTRLVLEAIAKAEDIKVSAEEIDAEYESIAKRYNMDIAKVRQVARVDLVGYDVVLRKATDFVRESVNK